MVWITVFSMHYAFWVTFAQGRCPLPCGDMCWDEKFPILLCIPLVIQKQSVPPRPWGDRGATHDIWRRSSCLFLYLLAPAWGAQRIDGERSSWSLPSEIAAEIKLVAGRREKKRMGKRDCCEAEKPQHRAGIIHWEPRARHKDIRLVDGCGNKPSVLWFQWWKVWQLNTEDVIQHHIFSCTVLWAGYINNTLPAKSLVPNAQPTHL